MADSAGPAVIHCSAGIGRTGVLIAVDVGIQGILQEDPKMDILRIVSTLRQDRAGMVQTRDQYRFIHQVSGEGRGGGREVVRGGEGRRDGDHEYGRYRPETSTASYTR